MEVHMTEDTAVATPTKKAMQINFPLEMKEEIERAAAEEGITQQQFVVNAVFEKLQGPEPVMPSKPKAQASRPARREDFIDEEEPGEEELALLRRIMVRLKGYLDNNLHDPFARNMAFVLDKFIERKPIPSAKMRAEENAREKASWEGVR
jgi:hypothetical protein